MPLYTFNGKLLVRDGKLAESANCCCECVDCLDQIDSVILTLSGYPGCAPFSYISAECDDFNTSFLLERDYNVDPVGDTLVTYKIRFRSATVCDHTDPGMRYLRQENGVVEYYVEEFSLQLTCLIGGILRLQLLGNVSQFYHEDSPGVWSCPGINNSPCGPFQMPLNPMPIDLPWEDFCYGGEPFVSTGQSTCCWCDNSATTATISLPGA